LIARPARRSSLIAATSHRQVVRWIRRLRAAWVLVAMVAGACSSANAPAQTAASATAPANACAPSVGANGTAYPGWPIGPAADLIPVLVSSQLVVGPNRFLLTVVDTQNKLVAAPTVGVDLRFFNLAHDPATAASSTTGTYMDSGNGSGLYRASVSFSCSGDWGVVVAVHRPVGDSTVRVTFSVLPASTTPAIGALAPHSDSPTAGDAAGIAAISTDPNPDPDYYRLTITQAVTSGKPSLIVFATPAFCRTRTCGPTLALIKSTADVFKGSVNLLHVEPYILHQENGGLQPVLDASGNLQPIPSVLAYGLQTEPFTFVVDATGRVAAEFEGIVAADELTAALQAVTASPGASHAPGATATPIASNP
jgi:hypothetical protein